MKMQKEKWWGREARRLWAFLAESEVCARGGRLGQQAYNSKEGTDEVSDKQEWLLMPGWVKKLRLVHVWKHAVRVAWKFMGRGELVGAFACEYTERRRLAFECDRLREKLMKRRRGGNKMMEEC